MKPDSVRATLGRKVYELPREDVKFLPIVNVTSEELARRIHEILREKFLLTAEVNRYLRRFSVSVEETRGQRVVFGS